MTLDLTTLTGEVNESLERKGTLNLPVTGSLNGVALWIDWQLDEKSTISGGPTAPVTPSQNIQWDVHSKQAVYFIKQPISLSDSSEKALNYQISFSPDTYEMKLNFSVR